jgi:hypothetical protein
MSDKLQFVGAFGNRRMAETSDKLKFVGHFLRPFALLPNSPTVSGSPKAYELTERSKLDAPAISTQVAKVRPVVWKLGWTSFLTDISSEKFPPDCFVRVLLFAGSR